MTQNNCSVDQIAVDEDRGVRDRGERHDLVLVCYRTMEIGDQRPVQLYVTIATFFADPVAKTKCSTVGSNHTALLAREVFDRHRDPSYLVTPCFIM